MKSEAHRRNNDAGFDYVKTGGFFNGGIAVEFGRRQPLNWRASIVSHDMSSLDYYNIEELLDA